MRISPKYPFKVITEFMCLEDSVGPNHLSILYLQLANLQLKTDIILYTNKKQLCFDNKKHVNSRQLPNKKLLKLKI